MSDNKKVAVNGNTSAYNPTTQDQITMAMLQNGGIARIQTAFSNRLDEAGWSQNLRQFVDHLFRSGEAQTYDEAMKIVMDRVFLAAPDEGGKAANGTAAAAGDLTIPRDAARDAAEVVKKELAKVVKMG